MARLPLSEIGNCSCTGNLQAIWFTESEVNSQNVPTGRVRRAVSHFVCTTCLRNQTVDDSFDGPWYTPGVK